MKFTPIPFLFIALVATPVVADTYRDALAALNSGHYDVARQVANQLGDDHPQKAGLLESIDTAVARAGQTRQVELSVEALEGQDQGTVYRSLEDPKLLRQLFRELDSSSQRHAQNTPENNALQPPSAVGESITVDQQVAMLKEKMASDAPQNGQSSHTQTLVMDGSLGTRPDTALTPNRGPAEQSARQCLSKNEIKEYFSKARGEAAAFAMDKARAIAKANEIRQQRALARMRLEITAELTAQIRAELDARFEAEVTARVAAIEKGRIRQEYAALVNHTSGEVELILARRIATGKVLGSGESRPWLELSAEKGNAEAQFELGQWYFNPASGEPDYQAAAHWWRRAQLAGNRDAEAALALLRQRQVGLPLAQNGIQPGSDS